MAIQFVSADWKDVEGLIEQYNGILESLGFSVYEDPAQAGSDSYGYIISDKKLTDKQLNKASARINGLEEGDLE